MYTGMCVCVCVRVYMYDDAARAQEHRGRASPRVSYGRFGMCVCVCVYTWLEDDSSEAHRRHTRVRQSPPCSMNEMRASMLLQRKHTKRCDRFSALGIHVRPAKQAFQNIILLNYYIVCVCVRAYVQRSSAIHIR